VPQHHLVYPPIRLAHQFFIGDLQGVTHVHLPEAIGKRTSTLKMKLEEVGDYFFLASDSSGGSWFEVVRVLILAKTASPSAGVSQAMMTL
jgi:hypothetical protein